MGSGFQREAYLDGGTHREARGPNSAVCVLCDEPGEPCHQPGGHRELAAAAYVWGLAPEFVQRFTKYNTIISAPLNTTEYGQLPAAWNDAATNAGDDSVLYINGFTDFTKSSALVLTMPPSNNQYYVVNYLDDYINTIGRLGRERLLLMSRPRTFWSDRIPRTPETGP